MAMIFIRRPSKEERMNMDFQKFKTEVMRLARKGKVSHLVPGSDELFRLWEAGLTPEQVIKDHCTIEASKKRHEK